MNKTVKKVLGVGILFAGFVFSIANTQAVDRYDCSRFDNSLGECRLSSKCEVATGKVLKTGQVIKDDKIYDADKYLLQADNKTKVTKKYCKLQDDRRNDENIAHATSECEKARLELDGSLNTHLSQKNLCQQTAKNTVIECVDVFPTSGGTAETRSLNRKFELACRKERKDILAENEAGLTSNAEEAEFAPFGVYEGPSFGGPGLKAGSRIAKSKLDNTISKETSIKKLAIGWVNLALSLVAILAVIAVIYAGVLYITSMGDDGNKDKAKNIIIYVALGILLIFGSYAIVQALLNVNTGNVSITGLFELLV